jgi:riboflavin kinase/FMN adenylyltransferase
MKQASVLTIGNFDGIHLGHRKLLALLHDIAVAENLPSVVISFTDHPAYVLKTNTLPKLLCPASIKKRELLALGIDEVELINFTPEFAKITALNFLKDTIVPVWKPKVILVGYDSHFGYKRQGDFQMLSANADEFGYQVQYVEPLMYKSQPISSSTIRDLLSAGEITSANSLLGRPYRISGLVGHGLCKGRDYGFPTANLILANPHQLVPKCGIYLSRVFLGDNEHFGLTNIGSSPTVKHTGIVEIETNILDFAGDIYGKQIEVELLHYLREEKMFKSIDELVAAMKEDVRTAREIISEDGTLPSKTPNAANICKAAVFGAGQ